MLSVVPGTLVKNCLKSFVVRELKLCSDLIVLARDLGEILTWEFASPVCLK